MNFNLIISTFRHHEEEAYNEILDILSGAGDSGAQAEVTDIIGIILGLTRIDPFQVIQIFHKLMIDKPWEIRYILRLLPIETVGPTQLEHIISDAKKLAIKIKKDETFRITVEKRHTSLSSWDVVKAVGGSIDNRVNLEKPDWIVLVEIVGRLTGISVLRSNQIFSSVIEKRKFLLHD
jgi:tRNA acetyltransferase TAN1